MNNSCFRTEVLVYNKSLFYHIVDACYLITMDNSTRRNNYIHQLNTYTPFHKVNIIHNKGFKKCYKGKWVKTEADDLSDMYGRIFMECLQSGHDKVLIFEDDFFFEDTVQCLQKYILDIQIFLDTHKGFMTYNLGPLPWFKYPLSLFANHYLYKGGVSHSVIYSKRYMLEYIEVYTTMNCLSDYIWNKFSENYCYHKPFCFQLFPKTANSKNWNSYIDINSAMQTIFNSHIHHVYIFSFTSYFAKIWYWILILIACKKCF